MDLARVIEYVDVNHDVFLEQLFVLLRQKSISAQNIGVEECKNLLVDMIKDAGMQVEVIPTKGHPIIYAEHISDHEKPTVLFYGHYDVQPPDPLDEWISPPFEPTLRNGKIYARGVGDNKGQLMAHVLAVKSFMKVHGALPVNVKFVFEGEEEVASPNIAAFVEAHREKLKTDLVYTSDGPLDGSGKPMVVLGVRGILYVELEAHGAKWDNHSGNKGGVVPNPAWTLVELLNTIKGKDGRVLIEGFYDDVEIPSKKIMDLIRTLPFDKDNIRETVGYDGFDMDRESYYRSLTLEPTFNIAGFTSGYGGEGSKTIIPHKAVLKSDMRLVMDQDPDDIFEKLVAHVKKHAPEVTVKRLGDMQPSRTSPDLEVIQVITKAVAEAYGEAPILLPSLGGSLPDYVWTKILKTPSVGVPYANADESNHAPNENLEVDKFFKGIRCSCTVLSALGRMKR
jgi:acetylornithine deacetylase/succinyl-diaminopimelate desuccinylase-like protein